MLEEVAAVAVAGAGCAAGGKCLGGIGGVMCVGIQSSVSEQSSDIRRKGPDSGLSRSSASLAAKAGAALLFEVSLKFGLIVSKSWVIC